MAKWKAWYEVYSDFVVEADTEKEAEDKLKKEISDWLNKEAENVEPNFWPMD